MTAALTGVAQLVGHIPQTGRLLVQFPVRAHAWVVSQVPSRGHMRGNHTLMFPSLKINKIKKIKNILTQEKFRHLLKSLGRLYSGRILQWGLQ